MGMGGITNMLGTLSPQQQQQLLARIQQAQAGAGGQGSQSQQPPANGGMSAPGGAPPMSNAGAAPPPQMSSMPSTAAQQMPDQWSSQTAAQRMGVPMLAQPPKNYNPETGQAQGSSFRASGVAAIPAAIAQIHRKAADKKTQQARAIAGKFLAMQADPQIKKAADAYAKQHPEVAKAMEKEEKEFAKIMSKAQDPTTPEGQGVQMAIRDIDAERQRQAAAQNRQAQAQTQLAQAQRYSALAAQEEATARKYNTQADQMGKVTERDKFTAEQKASNLRAGFQNRLDVVGKQVDASMANMRTRMDTLKQVAEINKSAKLGAAQIRQATAASSMSKEYKAIQDQVNELDKRRKNLQDLLKEDNKFWTGDEQQAAQVNNELNQVEVQRAVLQSQLQMLDQKYNLYQQRGILPAAPAPQQSSTTSSGTTIHQF